MQEFNINLNFNIVVDASNPASMENFVKLLETVKQFAEVEVDHRLECGECGHKLETRPGLLHHYEDKHPGIQVPPGKFIVTPRKKSEEDEEKEPVEVEKKLEPVIKEPAVAEVKAAPDIEITVVEGKEYYKCEKCDRMKLLSKKKAHDIYEKRRASYDYKPRKDPGPQQDSEAPPELTVLPEDPKECPFCHETKVSVLGVQIHVGKRHPEKRMLYQAAVVIAESRASEPAQESTRGVNPEDTVYPKVGYEIVPTLSIEKPRIEKLVERSYVVDEASDDSEECVCGAEVLKKNIGVHQMTSEHKLKMIGRRR